MSAATADEDVDKPADDEIRSCLLSVPPTSFFLYAGAGSGKTRSLVSALQMVIGERGEELHLRRKQVAVITYTNAACDEIKQRLEFDPRIDVRTIHSFAWELIRGFDNDIRKWLAAKLSQDITELEGQQARGRAGAASVHRAAQIESKTRRLASLPSITRFIYSPTSDNRSRDALNHAEVIGMASAFLIEKKGLQRLLISRYPFLLIDESQDTTRVLMDAFLAVQASNETSFCLGLFGDTMQRIYADGKVDLQTSIPSAWKQPVKQMNHRSRARVVQLVNRIRADADGQEQRERSDKQGGVVRFFIVDESEADRSTREKEIAEAMGAATGDAGWSDGRSSVKTLILEHHMAARRFGFEKFFAPLYRVDKYQTSLLDGSLPGLTFFTHDVLPLAEAVGRGERFRIASHLRNRSPLFSKEALKAAGAKQQEAMERLRAALASFSGLVDASPSPSLSSVLENVGSSGLFYIPESLQPFVGVAALGDDPSSVDGEDDESKAWLEALGVGLDEVGRYDRYIRRESPFDTHQGVKGLEFPRVMVVISDEEARGFLFSYEKLFGAKEQSQRDMANLAEGKETSVDRTRRLFYVTCSRAEESLAVVCYSQDPSAVRKYILERKWCSDGEVVLWGQRAN